MEQTRRVLPVGILMGTRLPNKCPRVSGHYPTRHTGMTVAGVPVVYPGTFFEGRSPTTGISIRFSVVYYYQALRDYLEHYYPLFRTWYHTYYESYTNYIT